MPILLYRHEQHEIENSAKMEWLMTVLHRLGVPLDDWPEKPTMADLRKARVLLKKLDLDIIDDSDSGIEIYCQGELIAEWRRPFYKLVSVPKELDPKYKFYLELHPNYKVYIDLGDDEEEDPQESNSNEED